LEKRGLEMNTNRAKRALTAFLWTACAASLSAQSDMKGHWTGTLNSPAGPIDLGFDLDKIASGWVGSASIPMQGATGIPLDAISFIGGKATFRIQGAAGDPTFVGTLSADGKSMEGTFATLPLKLGRTGEAKVEMPKASPPVAEKFLGTWEGTVQTGPGLRMMLTLSNGAAGAEAVLISMDQNNAQIPVSSIAQSDVNLTLEINAVGGAFHGTLSQDGTQLNGTLTQRGNEIPLDFKKTTKP
jgi:hypothetical protein